MKIILQGYVAAPNRGSEAGICWNWAKHLAAYHQVYMVTSIIHRDTIEQYLADNPIPNLRFVWVDVPKYLFPFKPAGRKILLHYSLWLRRAAEAVRELSADIGADIIHHIGYSAFYPVPRVYDLGVPFIWGPLGGGMTMPEAYGEFVGPLAWRERMRSRRVRMSAQRRDVAEAAHKAALILAVNHETGDIFRDLGAPDVRMMVDCGLPPEYDAPAPPEHADHKQLNMLYAGLCAPRKAVSITVEAMGRVADLPVYLNIAGQGRQIPLLKEQAARLGIADKVNFLGVLKWTELQQHYLNADAFAFTSLRDTFGTVILESMANALPVLTLNHQGVGTFLPDNAAIKAPVTTPEETVSELAAGMRYLLENPQERLEMGRNAWHFAQQNSWAKRTETMLQIYDEVAGKQKKAA